MKRQVFIGGAVSVAVVIGGILYFGFGGRDSGSPTLAPITGPERAEEARGVIADIERAREGAAAEGPRPVERPGSPAEPADQPAGGAAVATTPAAPAAELDTAFSRAEAFRKAGQLADAQLLYFYAARDGHPRAAFEYASMNDPNHHSPETSLLAKPDAFQAYRWYTAAIEGGVAAAQERLEALREWAVAAAADGDHEADRLLLQWEQ